MTDYAADDMATIRARMNEIAKERGEILSQPSAMWCECGHNGFQMGRDGERVCSGCQRPKVIV